MTGSTLEQRVQQWEDTVAIQKLKFAYGRFIDEGLSGGGGDFPPQAMLDQFTDDAVWEAEFHGRFEGKEAIRDFFARVSGSVTFSLHYMMNPTIEIAPSGREATGHWVSFETLTVDGTAYWLATTYDDVYTKESGRWQFRHVSADIFFFSPFDKGWAVQPFPA